MAKRRTAKPSSTRQFLRVVNWGLFQGQDELRRKPDPPWAWCRLPRSLLNNPVFVALTWPQRGAFAWLLLLAAETGNLIPFEAKWLRSRAQLDARLLASLIDLGVIEKIALRSDSPKIKALRRTFAGHRPVKNRLQEGEGEGETDLDKDSPSPKSSSKSESGGADDGQKDGLISSLPAPAPKKKNGRQDDREFEVINALVLELATKLRTTDPARIQKLGHSRKISLKQCAVAINQLRERGKLVGIEA